MNIRETFIIRKKDIRYQILDPITFEEIAEQYAIEFAEWAFIYAHKYPKCNVIELMQIFKREKYFEKKPNIF